MADDGTRVALVTGASRGIGRAAALALGDAGFRVGLLGRRVTEGDTVDDELLDKQGRSLGRTLESVARELAAAGHEGRSYRFDLVDRATADAAVAAVLADWGRIDVLVNNAVYQGPGLMDPVATTDIDGLERAFVANVVNVTYLIQRVLAARTPGQGEQRIINVSSGAANYAPSITHAEGGWGFGYAATKAAVERMAALAVLEDPTGATLVFSLDPGFSETEAVHATLPSAEGAAPVEVAAGAIAWLAHSPDAPTLSGHGIVNAEALAASHGLVPGWPPAPLPARLAGLV